MSVRIGYHGPKGNGSRELHLFHFLKVNPEEGRWVIVGYHRFARAELIDLRDNGTRMRLWALGVISFAPDVTPALFDDVFEAFTVRGVVRNKPERRSVDAGVAAPGGA